ncbi:amino acid ABC transporter permease [Kitasatospora sp. MMS16-BH015]|uniref:amino acid ABC transporter permease n=1 Tax=Kitasatospora sp. MMS16-BH015 TaxID=2018025 RepID=UPI000CA102A5|nr:amino acid ABC transporter permease [Kitasatospora sp. MMS16-BH015]AUG79923.1 amino acid ABC transporter permease [Kitasatospora sp. MMS16-BH015]
MGILFEDGNFALFRDGFLRTVELSLISGALALLLGVLLAAFRVSPVPVLRAFGTGWVTIFRNTPLTLLFLAVTFVLPRLEVHLPSFTLAVIALGSYTGSFVCEAIRSGINTVPIGQAEAARSLGLNFGQTLTSVVLPQAVRTAVPPLGSVFIALPRNSAIAGAFNVDEIFSVQQTWVDRGYSTIAIFCWIALAFLLISTVIAQLFRFLENRLAVAR